MSETTIQTELAEIFGALHLYSLTAFSYKGGAPIAVPPAAAATGTGTGTGTGGAGQSDYASLLDSLRNFLYGQCYVRAPEADGSPAPAWGQQSLLPALMQANPTVDRWDPHWVIYQVHGDGSISAQKGERSRTARSGEYASDKVPGLPIQIGDKVNLRVYPGSAELQPGFYFVFSNTLTDQFDEYSLLRFYFNISAEGAPELLRAVASLCNRYHIPFRYKTLTDPAAYRRADGAVLYCAKRYYAIVAGLLAESLPDAVTAQLRPATPLFTQPLRSGIGMAEDPGTGESFGMHRCRLVAEGVLDAWLAGSQTADARLAAVEKRFAASGHHLNQPYLNAGSVNLYASPLFTGGIAL